MVSPLNNNVIGMFQSFVVKKFVNIQPHRFRSCFYPDGQLLFIVYSIIIKFYQN
jgi:hypothetical protein